MEVTFFLNIILLYSHKNIIKLCMCVHAESLSHIQLFATPWTVACQAPLSTGFSRHEYWRELPFLLQGIFPTQGLNPGLLHCRWILYLLSHQITI